MNIAGILKSEYRNTKYETNPKFEFSNFQNKKPPISYIKTKRLVWNFADYSLPDGTALRISVARTHRNATSISERQREVWNIAANLSRTF